MIHLECATDSEHFYDRIKRMEALRRDLDEGRITHEQFAEEMGKGSRDIRYHGTAVFLVHKDRRYLITARHVVWNEQSANREYQEESDRAKDSPEHIRETLLQSARERSLDNIFNIIFRVPSLDEVLRTDSQKDKAFLMNLGAGPSYTMPYTFSVPDLDLAIISLDQRDSKFADELTNLGYRPVMIEDVADEPSKEGAEVYTVGFPSATALLGQVTQHPATAHWSSSYFSLPTYSFGRVSMVHEALNFFWVDMSIYPGNSGGPVIEEDKLVGIVSGQPTIPLDQIEQLRTRIPFGMIIKAKYISELISKQEKKDTFAA